MQLSVTHQESNSRGELLLRTFFGSVYMVFPHLFLLFFAEIWARILGFIAWWVILFTGRYPENMFAFQVKLMQWNLRLSARMYNLCDGYPAFWPSGTDDSTSLFVEYPESLSRGKLLLRTFFGIFYVYIPHLFLLFFIGIWASILNFISWWVILFTGTYPISNHAYMVRYLRWSYRLNLYMLNMTDTYPTFNGNE